MKKILAAFILVFFSMVFTSSIVLANNNMGKNGSDNCKNYDFDKENINIDIGSELNKCLKGVELVDGTEVSVEGGFGTQIKMWTKNIGLFLGVFAVGSIILGGFMMTTSAGEEEKIKKGKDVVKWGIIGFLGVVGASALINIIVKVMYSI